MSGTKIEPKNQRLITKGQELNDDLTISDLGLIDGELIILKDRGRRKNN